MLVMRDPALERRFRHGLGDGWGHAAVEDAGNDVIGRQFLGSITSAIAFAAAIFMVLRDPPGANVQHAAEKARESTARC